MNKTVIIAGIGLVAAAGVAAFIYIRKRKKIETIEEAEVAYTFEEAVEKAKKRMADGKDDGVKLVAQGSTAADIVSYHRIASTYSDDRDDVMEEEPEPVFDPNEIEAWPDEKDGLWYRISEDTYRFERGFDDKVHYCWDGEKPYLTTYDEDDADNRERVEHDELFRRVVTLSRDSDGPWYFANDETSVDAEVVLV